MKNKRIFSAVILMLLVLLSSCTIINAKNTTNETINITSNSMYPSNIKPNIKPQTISVGYKINDKLYTIFVPENTIITPVLFPINADPVNYFLYYDEEYKNRYDNAPLNTSTILYVKMYEDVDSTLLQQVKDDFYSQYGGELQANCYGKYGDSVIFFDATNIFDFNKTKIYLPMETYSDIYNYIFVFSAVHYFLLWNNGEFYTAEEDMERLNLISKDDAERLYNIHITKKYFRV